MTTSRSSAARAVVRHGLAACLVALAGYSGSVCAEDGAGREQWRAGIDLVIARPIGIVITAVGAVAFVVALPFTAASGSNRQSAHSLVVGPALETFVRCLGCVNAGRVHAGERAR